jgi:O-antigen ligase
LKTSLQESAARAIDAVVFYSLLAVIALAAIPYGAVEPWWKSLVQCLVFVLTALSVIAKLLRPEAAPQGPARFDYQLFWPIIALIAFAFLQTVRWPNSSSVATISADTYQTRQFIIHLLALLGVGWLLLRHTSSRRRLRNLVELVIAVGVVSALFGLWRQASQQAPGFVLPHLRLGFGYAQFINSNHFAFLMEMALGLTLGIAVCRGVTGRRLAAYFVAALPMWAALILANSRGGILSILCQVLFLALLSGVGADRYEWQRSHATRDAKSNLLGRMLRASRTVVARGVLIAALLAGAITTVVLVGGDPLAARVDSLAIELDRKTADTFTLRPTIWRATWELIKHHPLSGVGFGGYWIAITKYHAASGETTPQEAHNDYLELLASGGVIGVAIGIWFAVALIRTAKRKLDQLRSTSAAALRSTNSTATPGSFARAATLGALAGILTVAVHSLVDFGLHITINALVFTVLVAIVALDVERNEIQEDPDSLKSKMKTGS